MRRLGWAVTVTGLMSTQLCEPAAGAGNFPLTSRQPQHRDVLDNLIWNSQIIFFFKAFTKGGPFPYKLSYWLD